MTWCRWEDAKTCCEYLITRSITDEVGPKNMLRVDITTALRDNSMGSLTVENLCNEIVKHLQNGMSRSPAIGVAAVTDAIGVATVTDAIRTP
ncbi:hypothetical protein DYB30_009632 [Aphanomyces astaci]|uniref:Uncharacterized protein n=1 Tax=Aphanomyces astaci TaxID=112090 RepID=A0A397AEA0_APHAT|nr:hypothetical protein DYB36_013167 [Aphanomyces astaci]RHY54601.1 hypothetical protein DYB30_009632 [Aphanomyces astaci]RHY84948.1 hypothetical protein DYB26_013802 [Aphanomyces astaci]